MTQKTTLVALLSALTVAAGCSNEFGLTQAGCAELSDYTHCLEAECDREEGGLLYADFQHDDLAELDFERWNAPFAVQAWDRWNAPFELQVCEVDGEAGCSFQPAFTYRWSTGELEAVCGEVDQWVAGYVRLAWHEQ